MEHYGIYNTIQKEFQFGIDEPTEKKARKKLFEKIGYDSFKWRFEVRKIKEDINMNDELLNIAGRVMENFNPETDSADDFEKLPDGEYNCLLEEVKYRQNDKGTKWISFKFSILDGEYANRYLFPNFFFTEKTTERSIKQLMKLAVEFGQALSYPTDFQTFETLEQALQGLCGMMATVKQSTSKSDFTNFKITPTV